MSLSASLAVASDEFNHNTHQKRIPNGGYTGAEVFMEFFGNAPMVRKSRIKEVGVHRNTVRNHLCRVAPEYTSVGDVLIPRAVVIEVINSLSGAGWKAQKRAAA
jgi:hypothetical protein